MKSLSIARWHLPVRSFFNYSNSNGLSILQGMMRVIIPLNLAIGLLLVFNTKAQTEIVPVVDPNVTAIWRNPDNPVKDRVKALMSQLTLKEKISLLYWLAPAIPRLNIPEYHLGNEGLHGLVRPGENTVFPQSIGLGATFDPELVHSMASAVSDEARARWNQTHGQHLGLYSDVLTLWSPVVNMARDPRWGRTQETYGEDPWLTSRLGVAFVEGLQGTDPHYLKVIATPKHMAGYDQEAGRMGMNIVADERYLHEYDLFAVRACLEEGKAESVMTAYTGINGVPSSANKWLLTDVLRGQWGFKGYVVSDCGAVSHVTDAYHFVPTPEEAIAACLNAGLDVEGGYFAKYPDVTNKYLPLALDKGLVQIEVIDASVARYLTARFKLGMYDPPERIPYSTISPSEIGSSDHVALARKLAAESVVLLKNDSLAGEPLLPINPARTKKIIVVGPNADIAQLGDYSGKPTSSITPFAGLKARAEKSGIAISLVPWQGGKMEAVPSDVLSPGVEGNTPGLRGEYFASADLTGDPRSTRIDSKLNFNWAHIEPDPLAADKEFSVQWKGQLTTVSPGTYYFSITADGGYRLFIDDKIVIDKWGDKSAKRHKTSGKAEELAVGGHSVRLEYHHNGGETGFVWSWSPPVKGDFLSQLHEADLVIAVMGLSTNDETEGKDRTTLNLPPEQEDFLHKVLAANPRTVTVLVSGSSLAIPWAVQNVPAILEAWYPGQEGGNGIADVLFGDYNPSGRLPVTFYASDSQLRPMNEYDLTKGRTYMYLPEKPLYPFGYGLSYSTFKYANLKLSSTTVSKQDPITVSVEVTNMGKRDGDEVVQCYVHAQKTSVPMPIKQLWAFQRLSIPAGQTKMVHLRLEPKNFGHWDKDRQKFVVEPGKFDLEVGSSSDEIRALQVIDVTSP